MPGGTKALYIILLFGNGNYLKGLDTLLECILQHIRNEEPWVQFHIGNGVIHIGNGVKRGVVFTNDLEDADSLYSAFTARMDTLVHEFSLVEYSTEYELRQCNCSYSFNEHRSTDHSPEQCGLKNIIHNTKIWHAWPDGREPLPDPDHEPLSDMIFPYPGNTAASSPQTGEELLVAEHRRVFISNIDMHIAHNDLAAWLGGLGRDAISIILHKPSSMNLRKNSATVDYQTPADAAYITQLIDGREWGGQKIDACRVLILNPNLPPCVVRSPTIDE